MTIDRRGFLTACSRAGITSALLPGILYTLAAQNNNFKVTAEMIDKPDY